jgi:hypothetical protein
VREAEIIDEIELADRELRQLFRGDDLIRRLRRGVKIARSPSPPGC